MARRFFVAFLAAALVFALSGRLLAQKAIVDGDTWYLTGVGFPFNFGATVGDGADEFPEDFGQDDGAVPVITGGIDQAIVNPLDPNGVKMIVSQVNTVYPGVPGGVPTTYMGAPLVIESMAPANGSYTELRFRTSDGSDYSFLANDTQAFGTDLDFAGPGIRRGVFWVYFTDANDQPLAAPYVAAIGGQFDLPYGPHPLDPSITVLYAVDDGEIHLDGKFGFELEDEIVNSNVLGGALGLGAISGFRAGTVLDLLGDMNADGFVNNLDIAPFALAITDPDGYKTQYPGVEYVLRGNINADGQGDNRGDFNNLDIAPFAALLTGGAATAAVPEPSAAVLALFAAGICAATAARRRAAS